MERHQPEMTQHKHGVIQIFFDGVEVLRAQNSNDEAYYENFAGVSKQPEVLEMTWNGMVVYSLNIPSSIDRSKLQPDFLVRCFSKFLEERYPLE